MALNVDKRALLRKWETDLERLFVKVVNQDGSSFDITFKKLYEDLLYISKQQIFNSLENKSVVLIGSNSYEMILTIVWFWLKSQTIYFISPFEDDELIQKKIKSINEPIEVFNLKNNSQVEAQFKAENLNFIYQTKNFSNFNNDEVCLRIAPSDVEARFCVFTSGSTGYSKIVPIEESKLYHNVEALIEHHQHSSESTILTALPIFHVNCLFFSFFTSLINSGTLILFKNFDVKLMDKFSQIYPLSIVSTMPVQIKRFVETNSELNGIRQAKYFVSAAAPLSSTLVDQFYKKFKMRINQGYGLSEAVNFSTTIPIDLSDLDYKNVMINCQHPSIGCALKHNQILIINDGICIDSENTVGEIQIQSPHVMSRYLNSSDQETNGIFNTGDLGYFKIVNNRKFFFISGRIKDVIKRNGETISLREVDDHILNYKPLGLDYIAVGFEHDILGEEIGLLVTNTDEYLNDQDQMFEAFVDEISKRSAHFLIPRVIIFKKNISLRTPSGKPQRWKFKDLFADDRKSLTSIKPIVKNIS